MPKKKNNRRSNTKNPALKPEFNLKTRYDLIDYDYIDQLSPKDKEWLNKFTEEYTNDKLNRKNLKKNLHNTKALKKDCDDRNNARNRCILTIMKASGGLVDNERINETQNLSLSPEEKLMIKEELAKKKRRPRKT